MVKGVTMDIEQTKISKTTVVLALSGRLDTASAPLLERKIKQASGDCTELVLDFAKLSYISSMGLRVLLQAKKTLKEENRHMVVKNVSDSVREVFEITGFLHLMVQEEKFVVVRKEEPGLIVLSLNGEMKIENIPMLSKELLEIRERNFRRPVSKTLAASGEAPATPEQKAADFFTVILDASGLDSVSLGIGKHLKQAIEDSAWENRKLSIEHAEGKVRADLLGEGLGNYLVLGS
jgi:anti-sigma B factor antagonist